MQTNIRNFSNDFADGVLGDNSNGLKPADLIKAVNAELTNNENKGNLSNDALTRAQQANDLFEIGLGNNGHFTPPELTNTPRNDIAKAKALVKKTRTWITALGGLETPAKTFGTETETITNTFDTNAQAILEVIGQIISTAGQAINEA